MDNLPRFIFYASGVFILSAALILFSSEFLTTINNQKLGGTLLLFGYGLVYMNLVFASSRRFMRRLDGTSSTPYIFAFLIALPPIVWVNLIDANIGDSKIVFMLTVLVGCALGAYFGHRAGLKAQVVFQKNLNDYINQDKNLPNDLKRSHDNLNKN